ncbi:class I SAM-dependent methyltransferase [Streptomyces sp. NBC_01423]|uniref:class I SAM-dependent methyltransferase n=1 Tax=Streptomyces sp. NBC_01423 TaxID=2903860 RepID=UPI002E283D11|nr:class I SAM-dependent methyltransferase [Streptomyces sp. NBC_01423]
MTTTHSPDAVPGPSRALSFDRAAAQYAAARPSYPDALFDAVEDIAGRPLRGARTLDVGAGTGISTRRLHDRGARVVAVEPGPGMAAQLRRDLPDVPLVRGDGNRLPFATASADLITYAQSWHWTDHARAGAEVRRVLRPGGALALWWNVTDNTVPWLAAQEERLVRFFGVGPEHLGPRRAAAQDRDLPPELDFTHRRVPWTRRVPLATHVDNLGSHSAFLTIEDKAARDFLAEERALLLAEFPDGTVEEAYVVELHAAVR